MNRKEASRANVFLIELIVTIVVFAVAAAILLQVFVRADGLSRDASELSDAAIAAENAAEQLRSLAPKQTSFYYDKDWQAANADRHDYEVLCVPNVKTQNGGTLAEYEITVLRGESGEEVYRLSTAVYDHGGEGGSI